MRHGKRDLRVEDDVEVGIVETCEIMRRRAQRRGHSDVNSDLPKEPRDLLDVVAMTEAERGRPQKIAARTRTGLSLTRRPRESPDKPVEGLRRAPILFLAVSGQLQRNDGNGQIHRPGEAARIVLEELGGARGADDDGFRREAVVSLAYCGLEQLRRVGAQIARLEGRICDWRPRVAAFDHRE